MAIIFVLCCDGVYFDCAEFGCSRPSGWAWRPIGLGVGGAVAAGCGCSTAGGPGVRIEVAGAESCEEICGGV